MPSFPTNGKNVTFTPSGSDAGARTYSPFRQYWITPGILSPRAPSFLLVIRAKPSDGAGSEPIFCPRCTLSVVPRSILFFENTFTPSPRRSVIVSRSPTTTGETSTLPAPGAVTVS